MLAFIVVLGIVVLATLIVLSATVMAGRADDAAATFTPSPKARAKRDSTREKLEHASTDPMPAGVTFMSPEDDDG